MSIKYYFNNYGLFCGFNTSDEVLVSNGYSDIEPPFDSVFKRPSSEGIIELKVNDQTAKFIGNGWIRTIAKENELTNGQEMVSASNLKDKYSFMTSITPSERMAIYKVSETDYIVKDFLTLLQSIQNVDLLNEDTIRGIQYISSLEDPFNSPNKILTAERVAEILNLKA